MHLAEFNISKLLAPLESPQLRDFVANVDHVNSSAEHNDGLIGRSKDDTRDPVTVISPRPNDNIYTLRVWQSPEQLEHSGWNIVCRKINQRRQKWFRHVKSHCLVKWWVDEGSWPTVAEAKSRLGQFDANGNYDHAFGWSHLPLVQRWQTQGCA